MPKNKKKKSFIDKKNAVTFHLVHRSQKDPLQADEDAPKRVLIPEKEKKSSRLEEQQKFGVFYDDDYDYLQHLKDVNEINNVAVGDVYRVEGKSKAKKEQEPVIVLPSSVFESEFETEEGLLNKAAPRSGPQLDWDPDIVAALDDDFDFDNPDNQLDDDFIVQANVEGDDNYKLESTDYKDHISGIQGADRLYQYPQHKEGGDSDEDEGSEEGDYYPSDEADFSDEDGEGASDVGSLGDMKFDDLETKTRFTNYSMSSSVIKRNAGLTLLDDRFEKLYEEYDDDEVGALDQDDIVGFIQPDSKILDQIVDEFEEKTRIIAMKDVVKKGDAVDVISSDEGTDTELEKRVVEEPKEKWDCESILSTYSNLYNHPKTIEEPRKSKKNTINFNKHGMPEGVLKERGLTRKQEEQISQVKDPANTYRPKDESTDEKKERKQAVKEERRLRRMEKKQNKSAFKSEEIRQQKEQINFKHNIKGVKIM